MTQATQDSLNQPAESDIQLSALLDALSDPQRLAIVAELHERGESVCSTLLGDVPKSTRSHHLKVLREAGVTWTRLEGTERHVRLRYESLARRFPGLLESVLAATTRKR